MKVTVRLFAQFRGYAPLDGRQMVVDIDDGSTVLDVADQLGFGDQPAEILVNGERAHNGIKVQDGDVVSYFPALAGG